MGALPLQQSPEDGSKPYSYRYIGALVADFHRTLLVIATP